MHERMRQNTRWERVHHESESQSGFLLAAVNSHFRSLEDGRKIFYPQGAYGRRGYVVSSTDQEMILRTNVREFSKVWALVIGILGVVFSGFLSELSFRPILFLLVGSVPGVWLASMIYFWRFTHQMESVNLPNTPVAHWRSLGHIANPILLIWQVIFVAAIGGFSLYRFSPRQDPLLLLVAFAMAVGLIPLVIALWSWLQTYRSVRK